MVAAAAATQWLQGYGINRLSYRTVRDMRVQTSEKIGRMPLSFIDGHPHGDLISRVVNDVDQVGDGLLQGLTNLFTGVVTIVGTLVFMLSVSVPMAVVVVLVTPLSIVAAGLIAKLSNKSFAAQQRIQGELGGHVEEYVGQQRLVVAFGFAPRAEERFDRLNSELYTAGERAAVLKFALQPRYALHQQHHLRRGWRHRVRMRHNRVARAPHRGRRADVFELRQPIHQAV